MRTTPSIVPHGPDRDVYLVMEDFGILGRAWREMDADRADRASVIRDLVRGEYSKPLCIVAFNIAEGWCRDVTTDIAENCAAATSSSARFRTPCWCSWRRSGVR